MRSIFDKLAITSVKFPDDMNIHCLDNGMIKSLNNRVYLSSWELLIVPGVLELFWEQGTDSLLVAH
jgi:hypothetical protein